MKYIGVLWRSARMPNPTTGGVWMSRSPVNVDVSFGLYRNVYVATFLNKRVNETFQQRLAKFWYNFVLLNTSDDRTEPSGL